MFDAQPVLTVSELTKSEDHVQGSPSDTGMFSRLLPLIATEQDAFHQTHSRYTRTLQQLPELLASATEVLRDALANDTIFPTTAAATRKIERFQEDIERVGFLASEEVPGALDAQHLARACHLNFIIFYNLIVHRIPNRHRSNQKYADGLFSAVRCIQNSTWDDIPYLRLWM